MALDSCVLYKALPAIESAGHKIRFSVSRGPLNVASFLMGTTEFLTLMMMDPEATQTTSYHYRFSEKMAQTAARYNTHH
ncbi:MAG: hypothetical protein Q7U47_12720 [Paludibacter sp.]|nr:hypothetical protein [Paludibacter sp.]